MMNEAMKQSKIPKCQSSVLPSSPVVNTESSLQDNATIAASWLDGAIEYECDDIFPKLSSSILKTIMNDCFVDTKYKQLSWK